MLTETQSKRKGSHWGTLCFLVHQLCHIYAILEGQNISLLFWFGFIFILNVPLVHVHVADPGY